MQLRLPIAYTLFADGVMRAVYEDACGQYVIDSDGCRVRGVWFIPRDECDSPIVVHAAAEPADEISF